MIEHRKTSVTYRGDGVTTSFPFSFDISSADTIRVAIYDTATEITTEITRDYFVDVSAKVVHYPGYAPGQAPAAAVQPPKLPNGKTITIYRKTPINQLMNLGTKYPLPSIETMSDKATAILQEHDEMFGRTVTLHAGDPKTPEQRLTDLQTYVLNAKNAASAADQSARSAGDSKASAASSASSSAQAAAASESSRQASATLENDVRRMTENVREMHSNINEKNLAADKASEAAMRAKESQERAEDAANRAVSITDGNAFRRKGRTIIQGDADWNTFTAPGAYRNRGANMSPDLHAPPTQKYGLLIVERIEEGVDPENDIVQTYYPTDSKEGIWYRRSVNAFWATWETIACADSPAFTGTPTAPTAGRGTNNGQIATTAYVVDAVTNGAAYSAKYVQNTADNMQLHWEAREGQPLNIWGSYAGDPQHAYVFNPANFRVANANTLGDKSLSWIISQINAANTGIVASNLAQNGWVKFANGLIAQWMYHRVSQAILQTITFPVQFTKFCNVWTTRHLETSDASTYDMSVKAHTLTGATISKGDHNTAGVFVFALGV